MKGPLTRSNLILPELTMMYLGISVRFVFMTVAPRASGMRVKMFPASPKALQDRQ